MGKQTSGTLTPYLPYPEFIPHDQDDQGNVDHYVPQTNGLFEDELSETESLDRSVAFLAECH